ncbi:hypothetical protein Tco_0820200 [Tanacetum coccineum]|uniref:Reverse transcriptase domain-containing protein n=1 Tax=Tanacetum coccineum TaxID=301880 RepID=A0ABQ5A8T3_9ASTR
MSHNGFSEYFNLIRYINSLKTNDQDALDSVSRVWISQISQEISQKRTRERMSDQEAKEIKAKARENQASAFYSQPQLNHSQLSKPAPLFYIIVLRVCKTARISYSRSRANDSRVSANAHPSTSSPSISFELQQIAASLEDKMDIRMSRLEKAISEKKLTPATVKAVEEETNDIEREKNFNSNHNQKLPWKHSIKNRQNNQGSVYQPPTNQPPVNQALPYQAPIPQIQGVSKTDFDNYVKANNAILKNVQNQGQNLQNKMANVTSLLTSLCNNFNNSASTLKSGTLPSQTVTNPREHVNDITTRSGKTLEGPSTPVASEVSTPKKEPEQNPETSTDKVQKPSLESTAQVPPPEEEESIFMEIPKHKS